MNKGRVLVLVGSLLLIAGGFLPWISAPDLFGYSAASMQGIETGWEGDGALTAGAGLVLLLSELLPGGWAPRWFRLIRVVLAGLPAWIVILDVRRILELAPAAGYFAAADMGLYVTFLGALGALIGCTLGRSPGPAQAVGADNAPGRTRFRRPEFRGRFLSRWL